MDAFLNPCVRSDGERLDPSLSPAPSLLAEDGRGVLYALGADGVIRACPARLLNAAARGSIADDALPTGAQLRRNLFGGVDALVGLVGLSEE